MQCGCTNTNCRLDSVSKPSGDHLREPSAQPPDLRTFASSARSPRVHTACVRWCRAEALYRGLKTINHTNKTCPRLQGKMASVHASTGHVQANPNGAGFGERSSATISARQASARRATTTSTLQGLRSQIYITLCVLNTARSTAGDPRDAWGTHLHDQRHGRGKAVNRNQSKAKPKQNQRRPKQTKAKAKQTKANQLNFR